MMGRVVPSNVQMCIWIEALLYDRVFKRVFVIKHSCYQVKVCLSDFMFSR